MHFVQFHFSEFFIEILPMMFALWPFILYGSLKCVDQPEMSPHVDLHAISIQKAFEGVSIRDFVEYSDGRPAEEICQWRTTLPYFLVQCLDGVLIDLGFRTFDEIGDFNIGFFPNDMESLSIILCAQKFQIQVRHFPSKAKNMNLSWNYIWGAPDLGALPRRLSELDLSNNRLIGPIYLCELPPNMRTLSLADCRISQQAVWYENLPQTIQLIFLTGNSINQVRAMPGTPPIDNKDIIRKTKKGLFF